MKINMTNEIPSREEILAEIQENLGEIVEEPDLELTEASDADEVPDWDSVNHVKLILCLEGVFDIRFNPDEISSMTNVGDLVDMVTRELKKS
jgi:acyl carrier protein